MFNFGKKEETVKVISIEGMHCGHCKANVEKALGAVKGAVSAEVDLENKTAEVKLTKDVPDSVLKEAVENIGFEVVSIS